MQLIFKIIFTFVCVEIDLAVWRISRDSYMFSCRACIPEGHTIQLSWWNWSGDQQEQQTTG